MAYTALQKKEHIHELQHYLHGISFFDELIPRVNPDGIYGTETAAAVRAFQRRQSIPETGTADPNTWDEVVEVYRFLIDNNPFAYDVFPSATFVLGEGDSGLLVYIIQAMLNDIAGRFDNMPAVTVDGRYGAETAEAVRHFQRNTGLPQSGRVDVSTWNLLTGMNK